ncbi:hypothetical protein O7618_06160 [Micromonospora sp. WMMD980]|nr:hypothetical protein [Micromonospora sp. WMMD980]MDG4800132.1 hypothetical protein [Micromonospora sp. WMMD980]
MANRARNDIQESLQDLGKNSVYPAGEPVSPAIEEPNDPACRPLLGWEFTFGSGYTKNGPLSTVTGVNGTAGPTVASVPWLDPAGDPTGGTVAGAVTVTLTPEQVALAMNNDLWVQGGTPDDPLLAGEFGAGAYGFGALRCAVDNLNGDNVEFISFPNDSHHVFCYAYYVSPEPGLGNIVIRKALDENVDAAVDFTYDSNLTYNPSGQFQLSTDGTFVAEQTFVRADSDAFGGPYTATETAPPGWSLASLDCDTTRPGGGTPASSFTTDLGSGAISIDLAEGDIVTCTYTNTRRKPTPSPTLSPSPGPPSPSPSPTLPVDPPVDSARPGGVVTSGAGHLPEVRPQVLPAGQAAQRGGLVVEVEPDRAVVPVDGLAGRLGSLVDGASGRSGYPVETGQDRLRNLGDVVDQKGVDPGQAHLRSAARAHQRHGGRVGLEAMGARAGDDRHGGGDGESAGQQGCSPLPRGGGEQQDRQGHQPGGLQRGDPAGDE